VFAKQSFAIEGISSMVASNVILSIEVAFLGLWNYLAKFI
jgi:hypothetical protein